MTRVEETAAVRDGVADLLAMVEDGVMSKPAALRWLDERIDEWLEMIALNEDSIGRIDDAATDDPDVRGELQALRNEAASLLFRLREQLDVYVAALRVLDDGKTARVKATAEDMLAEDRQDWEDRLAGIAAEVEEMEESLQELVTLLGDGPSLREAFAAQGRLLEINEDKLVLEQALRSMLAEFKRRPDVGDLWQQVADLAYRLQAMASPLTLLAGRFEDIVGAGGYGRAGSAGPREVGA